VPAIDASLPFVAQLRGLVSKPELRGLSSDLRPATADLARLSTDSVPLYAEVRRNAACQNDVVLPWSHDKVPDEQFPAEGKVFEEAPKVLPGLAGESRSGDANGQWFRVLAAGGMNLVTLKPGVFATTPSPIKGTNPPKPPARPPLRQDVRCQTQEPPDLRSEPGPPPEQRTVSADDPAFKARWALAQRKLVDWMRGQLAQTGLDKQLKISDQDVTQAIIGKAAAAKQAQDAARAAKIRGLGG
jgi:hypothetical protein